MEVLSPEIIRLTYGFPYFVMGLAVFVRAFAYPSSNFRNRLIALGAFGLIHATAIWLGAILPLTSPSRFVLVQAIYLPSHLALIYFAFGANDRNLRVAHAVALAMIVGLTIASFLAPGVALQSINRLGVAFPAAVCAGLTLAYDKSFRFGPGFAEKMRWLVATGFLSLAALHLVQTPTEVLPAWVFTSADFEAMTSVSIQVLRAIMVLLVMVGTLGLLNSFDNKMRRQNEDAIAVRDARLQRALHVGRLGSWEWHLAAGKVVWSNQTYRIFGLQPQSFDASLAALLERVHPDDRELVEETIRSAPEQHAPYRVTYRILRPDGSVRIVQERGEIEADASGKPIKLLATIQNVTKLEQAKTAERDKDAKLSRILEVSPEAIIIADEDAHISLFNEGAQRIFGYSSDEAVGQSIEMLMPESFRAGHNGYVQAFASAQEVSKKMGNRDEVTGLRKNGETFPAKASISKLRTSDGITYTVVLRDISEERAIREELIAAKYEAEAASAAKSNFIANMSHELRTPLNAILGFSEIIKEEMCGPSGNGQYRDYASHIHDSGQHLLSIINDILNISLLDSGNAKLNEEGAIDVMELLKKCESWVEGQALDGEIKLHMSVAPNLPALRGDPRLLTQAILNLLSNAVKFTPRDGTIEIIAWATEAGGITVSIRDTGKGMTADQIAHIGEPFLQFDDSQKRKFDGTGLGLSITKRLVELHGGKLEVQSKTNIGTTMSINLPPERSVREKPSKNEAA